VVGDADAGNTVSFEYVRGLPIVKAHVNGTGPFNFIIDTGGYPSLISLSAASEAGIFVDTDRVGHAEGIGQGNVRILESDIIDLRIGGLQFGNFDAVAMDLTKISERLGIDLHGILGANFLQGRVTIFDYVNELILFRMLRSISRCDEYSTSHITYVSGLEFRRNDTIPLITIIVEDQALPVTLDTGSNIGLELFPAAVKRLELDAMIDDNGQSSAVGARG
jgi:hypothetical protein